MGMKQKAEKLKNESVKLNSLEKLTEKLRDINAKVYCEVEVARRHMSGFIKVTTEVYAP